MRDIMQSVFLPLTDHIMHYGVYFRTIFIPLCLFNRWLSLLMMRQNVLFSICRTCNVLLKVKDNTFLNLIMEYPRI